MKRFALFVVAIASLILLGACTGNFEVSFDTQGGSPVSSITVKSGSLAIEPSEAPTRAGYEFLGWFEDAAATKPFDFTAPISAKVKIYAGWRIIAAKHTITFDTQGGGEMAALELEAGKLITKPADLTREGYKFLGWFTSADATTAFDFTAPVSGPVTIYAGWQAKYVASFAVDGGSAIDPVEVLDGELLAKPADPTKAGYQFMGWYKEAAGTNAFDFSKALEGNVEVFAVWKKIHTVSFDVQGGNALAPAEVLDDSLLTPPIPEKVSEVEGEAWVFIGWYTDAALTVAFDPKAPISSDLVLYAKWENRSVYVVSFDTLGGNEIESINVIHGNVLPKLNAPYKPETEDEAYLFLAWYLDEELTVLYDLEAEIVSALKLYAKYEVLPKHLVSFDTLGGTKIEDIKVINGELLPEVVAVKAAVEEEVYAFEAWYLDKELTTLYDVEAPVEGPLVLYAKYVVTPKHLVKLDLQGGATPVTYTFGKEPVTGYSEGILKWVEPGKGLIELNKDRVQINASNFAPHLDKGVFLVFSIRNTAANAWLEFDVAAAGNVSFEASVWNQTNLDKAKEVDGGLFALQMKVGDSWVSVKTVGEDGVENLLPLLTLDKYVKMSFAVESAGKYRILYSGLSEATNNTDTAITVDNLSFNAGHSGVRVLDGELLEEPTKPIRDKAETHEWSFVGWYADDKFEIEYDFEDEVKAPMTLYAKWLPIWTVGYDIQLGDEIKLSESKVVDGRFVFEPYLDPALHADLKAKLLTHRVEYWYVSDEAVPFDFFNDSIHENMVLKAKWVERSYVEVSFEANGGEAVSSVTVEVGSLLSEPATSKVHVDPNKIYIFTGWYKDAALTELYLFSEPVSAAMTLHAGWEEVDASAVVVSFNTKTSHVIAPVVVAQGGSVNEPVAPERAGFKFGGWYLTARGLTWLEPEAVKFPYVVGEESFTLHAYYEPLNSKTHNWSKNETYITSMQSSTVLVLNPLTYRWSHENEYMSLMTTPLYSSEIDWDKAIEDGVAEYPSDFSKIGVADGFSIDALDYINILAGATRFPVDEFGDEHLTEDGKYDRDKASTYRSTKWTYHLNPDVVFEDGTPVTAYTYEFTLKQFLDPAQNNYRANSYYKTTENRNGYPIKNAFEYYTEKADWSSVGFKVISEYVFEVETWEEISQASAVGFGSMVLVHPAKYTASLTGGGTSSTYGTPRTPFISYGPYVMKSWDENQKIVFNKNYDYILKGTINYKSQEIQVVDNIDQQYLLFDRGELSVVGLSKDYYDKYVERPGIKKSYNGYPQNIHINLAEPRTETNKVVHPTIMYDAEFRQALFYGFDTKYYANSVYKPNTPTMFPMPGNAKNYVLDPIPFSKSPQHSAVLKEFGITDESAYIPERAKELFDAAYARWLAADSNNKGPVKLVVISENDDFSRDLVTYIKEAYEKLFGADKFELVIKEMDIARLQQETKNWNFDLYIGNVGFGLNTDAYFQYPAIAFYGTTIGGSNLGMSQPYDMSNRHWEPLDVPEYEEDLLVPGEYADLDAFVEYLNSTPEYKGTKYSQSFVAAGLIKGTTDEYVYAYTEDTAAYVFTEVEIDLTNTFVYMEEMDTAELKSLGLTWLYNELKASDGKAAGMYVGTLYDFLWEVVFSNNDPYSSSMKEPFEGAGEDLLNVLAVFETVFLESVPMIPTVERSSATLYADNVVIEWPEYSQVFGWGAARYRYLNTDPDFQ